MGSNRNVFTGHHRRAHVVGCDHLGHVQGYTLLFRGCRGRTESRLDQRTFGATASRPRLCLPYCCSYLLRRLARWEQDLGRNARCARRPATDRVHCTCCFPQTSAPYHCLRRCLEESVVKGLGFRVGVTAGANKGTTVIFLSCNSCAVRSPTRAPRKKDVHRQAHRVSQAGKAHSGKTDSGIATATEVLVKQVLLSQPKRVAESSLRTRLGRLPKSATCRKAVRPKAKVLHPNRRSKPRGGCVQLRSNSKELHPESRWQGHPGLRLPMSNESVPCCLSFAWALSSSKKVLAPVRSTHG